MRRTCLSHRGWYVDRGAAFQLGGRVDERYLLFFGVSGQPHLFHDPQQLGCTLMTADIFAGTICQPRRADQMSRSASNAGRGMSPMRNKHWGAITSLGVSVSSTPRYVVSPSLEYAEASKSSRAVASVRSLTGARAANLSHRPTLHRRRPRSARQRERQRGGLPHSDRVAIDQGRIARQCIGGTCFGYTGTCGCKSNEGMHQASHSA